LKEINAFDLELSRADNYELGIKFLFTQLSLFIIHYQGLNCNALFKNLKKKSTRVALPLNKLPFGLG